MTAFAQDAARQFLADRIGDCRIRIEEWCAERASEIDHQGREPGEDLSVIRDILVHTYGVEFAG